MAMNERSNPTMISPRLQMLAQLAEIIASVVGVITLLFLFVEVQENTHATRAAAYERSMEGLNGWRLTLTADPELLTR